MEGKISRIIHKNAKRMERIREESKMKKTLLNRNWWDAAVMRMLKTLGQVGVSAFGIGTIAGIDWKDLAMITIGAVLLSFFTSLAGLPEQETERID